MDIKKFDLVSLFEQSLKGIAQERFQESGVVLQVGDGICRVHGLTQAVYGELINFEGGNQGIIFDLGAEVVSIFLMFATIPVAELEAATRTGKVFMVPVGPGLVGRVVNALGSPIDGQGSYTIEEYRPVETEAPGIIERSPINESLETGIMAIDALVPIGKGQRELFIGNRNTGKTTLALDTILHQKDKNIICIYVSIAQRQANLARIVQLLEENNAMEYTIIVSADAGEAVLNHYLSPYVGCTMAEYLRDRGSDVLIVYDDLSNHAIAFRQMSLLLRRAPGREAYPGDVFYLHSRLLERAGKLARGGSITALPIAQIQGDDITAYIPTNLISITDGQIFLDTKLFNSGVRPAINIELSVSRVGGAAQTKAIKKMTRALRLEVAQYHELLDFVQFGTELDEISQRKLMRGTLVMELLKQEEHHTYSCVDQVLMLFLLRENFLDKIDPVQVHNFVMQFVSYVKSVYQDTYAIIVRTQDISAETQLRLQTIATEFSKLYVPPAQNSSMH